MFIRRDSAELYTASVTGGPPLSDCISGHVGTQQGLNSQEICDWIVGFRGESQRAVRKEYRESVIRKRRAEGEKKVERDK